MSTGATLTTVSSLLKEVYEPRIVSQLYDEAIGWKRIQSTSEGVTERAGGKYVDFPIVIGRNQGLYYRNEEEQLGEPKRATYSEVHVELQYGYARGRLSGPSMELAETNPQSFASAADREMQSMKEAVQRDQSRIFYGDSTGKLATLSAAMGGAGLSFTVDDIHWLEADMDIDIRVNSTGSIFTNGGNRTISSVASSTNTVTVEADSTTFDAGTTEGVYRQGNYNKEPEGLASIVDSSGTIYGVNPSTVDLWRAEETALNGNLSESVMIKMCDDIYTNGGKTTVILYPLGLRRAYHNLLVQQRRFTGTKEFAGGLVTHSFEYAGKDIPMVADPDLRPDLTNNQGTMYFLCEDEFKFYHTGDWKFVDRDGSMFKWVRDYDSYEFLMRRYWELGCSRRNSQGKLTGVTLN